MGIEARAGLTSINCMPYTFRSNQHGFHPAAAAPTPIVPVHEFDEKNWKLSMDVNPSGAFQMSKAALPASGRSSWSSPSRQAAAPTW